MKLVRIAALGLIAAVYSVSAYAVGDAGCGLGHLAWQGNNGKLAQILAATTNGTFGSQTFGITTGTSGCTSKGLVKVEHEQEYFANINRDTLYIEMSRGQGENLNALAALMGCAPETMKDFGKFTQANYSVIFPTEATSGAEMLTNLKSRISRDSKLSKACARTTAMN